MGKGPRQSGEACETAAKAAQMLNRQKSMLNRKNLGIMADHHTVKEKRRFLKPPSTWRG